MNLKTDDLICGRDVIITIDGRGFFQAEKIEIRRCGRIRQIRSCFRNDPAALVRDRTDYKLNLSGLRFRRPYENVFLGDWDNFELGVEIDGRRMIFSGCMWDDYTAAADKEKFREHISVIALRMETEEAE